MKFTPLAALLLSKFGPGLCKSPTPGGGGGAIPVYGLDRYVLLDGVWFLRVSIWGGGVTWVNFCWVRAAGLLEPLIDYSLLCGQV